MLSADVPEPLFEQLRDQGYEQIEHDRLTVGKRVRNYGEQYMEALRGTASVVAVFEKPNSTWARRYHQRDIEVVVRHDNAKDGPRYRLWTDYGTIDGVDFGFGS